MQVTRSSGAITKLRTGHVTVIKSIAYAVYSNPQPTEI